MKDSSMILIGVGGAGGRVVNDTATRFGLDPESVVAIDTDIAGFPALSNCRRHCIGQPRFNGNGTAGDASLAAAAAVDETATLVSFLSGIRLAVVVTGLGGGSGSGITPVLLRLAHERNIPTLVFTLSPFPFEDAERLDLARRTRTALEESGAVVVHFDNDALAALAPPEAGMEEVRRAISGFAAEGISLFWRLVSTPGYIGLDLATIVSLLRTCRGRARFSFATAQGENRVAEAAGALFADGTGSLSAPLATAPAVAFGILGGADLRLKEVGDAMAALRGAVAPGCRIRMGTVLEPVETGSLSLAAMVFENWNGAEPGRRIEDEPEPEAPPVRPPREPAAAAAAPEAASPSSPEREKGDAAPAPAPAAPAAAAPAEPRRSRSAARARDTRASTIRDHFQGTKSMVFEGEELDIPTYQRRGWNIQAD